METPATVSQWAEETFGPVGSNFSVACRANREMSELLSAVAADEKHPQLGEEIADVVIVLWRLTHRNGYSEATLSPDDDEEAEKNSFEIASASHSLAHLLSSLARNDAHKYLKDDVEGSISLLASVAKRSGIDLQAEIDKKMKINRARQWRLTDDGHDQHIES